MAQEFLTLRIDQTKSVGEIAATLPESVPLFEELGIDYYAHGGRQLREACQAVGLDLAETVLQLERAQVKHTTAENHHHWSLSPLTELTNHLISSYHNAARSEVARLSKLAREAGAGEEQKRPHLKRIEVLLKTLANDIDSHIIGEEEHLFPQIEALERAHVEGIRPELPYTGGIHNRILVEFHEHELIAEKVRKMRELSSNFAVPADASEPYKELMRGLLSFERNLHRHLHLENNILFPRAGELEHMLKPLRGDW
jgi:regulator of cell morphogenesis and NO signaling